LGVFQSIFGKVKPINNTNTYKEIGSYNARFYGFGKDIYQSEIVKSCIRTLAEHSSKANAKTKDIQLQRLIQYRPNIYMNGKDFLYKVRTMLEIENTAFIYIQRDDKGKCIGLYPVPFRSFEAVEYMGRLYIKFNFVDSTNMTASWEDLAVLRKDYNKSDISGETNDSLLETLELISTTNQGIANAVKSSANLRGILKSTKAMLSDDDIKKNKDRFVNDYMNLSNEGGIASLDSTQEFTTISMNPVTTNFKQMEEFRENVYRYYGLNDSIIKSDYDEKQLEAFYESKIETFLLALGLELTNKVYTDRTRKTDNDIIFESNRLQYASNTTKLAMVAMVDRGALTPNEWRQMFNLSPVEGGDKPIRRLDTAQVDAKEGEDNANSEQQGVSTTTDTTTAEPTKED
jgi:HK97 family phage portal protein